MNDQLLQSLCQETAACAVAKLMQDIQYDPNNEVPGKAEEFCAAISKTASLLIAGLLPALPDDKQREAIANEIVEDAFSVFLAVRSRAKQPERIVTPTSTSPQGGSNA